MSIHIIVGASKDSGVGKVSRIFGRELNCDCAVKLGGMSSGHTFYDVVTDKYYTSRMLPAANNKDDTTKYIFPKCTVINLDQLSNDMKEREVTSSRIFIDEDAIVITEDYKREKASDHIDLIKEKIGERVTIGKSHRQLIFAVDEIDEVNIIVEGEGSYEECKNYVMDTMRVDNPFMTAYGIPYLLRLSPGDIEHVILVDRIKESLSDDEDTEPKWNFDRNNLMNAIEYNNPTIVVLNGLDVIDPDSTDGELSNKQNEFIKKNIENWENSEYIPEGLVHYDRLVDYAGLDDRTLVYLGEIPEDSGLTSDEEVIEKIDSAEALRMKSPSQITEN